MSKLKLLTAVPLALVIGAAAPATVLAASSPTVVTGAATSIGLSSATLNGTVNPNGSGTTYKFAYGPTPALGAVTTVHSAGSGIKPTPAKAAVSGLVSGTTYYYSLEAGNSLGTTSGAVRTFKTSGNPPPQPTTGGPSSVTTSSATVSGIINPENQATTWYFEYGTTTAYGVQTVPQQVAGTVPVPVSQTLTGLAPGTTFHYALVATHGNGAAQVGADATFETLPSPRPVPRVAARTTPRRDKKAPFSFLTSGHIYGPASTPPALQCTGRAKITFYLGRRAVASRTEPVQPDCSFAAGVTFKHLPGHGSRHRTVKLKIKIRFQGNGYLAPASARTETVTLH
jgi:hypothetical protein